MYSQSKKTIAIVGLGLIGASLAVRLRKNYRVVGCSRSSATERQALRGGFVDAICPVEQLKGVDCVIACTPLWTLRDTILRVYDAVGESALITDVGSVKGFLRDMPGRFVGGHPMAGNEQSGIGAAKSDLFENATYCVVPYANSAESDVEFTEELARAVGAVPVRMDADRHDRLAADFSHMPHMAAYALSNVAIRGDAMIAGSGFYDSTRIAASDPAFWTEVVRLNRENVLCSLNDYIDELTHMRALLQDEAYDELSVRLAAAQQKRKRLQ